MDLIVQFLSSLTCIYFSEKYPRIAIFSRSGGQVWNDKQVVVDDSFERYSGYQYFGIIDHDEFFLPSKNRTLLETLVGQNIRDVYINNVIADTSENISSRKHAYIILTPLNLISV